MTQFEPHPDEPIAAPSRTSALAVTSLVMSLICCIPGLGAIGTLLGAGAIVGISKSEGRVKGMGLAVGGVIVGIITTGLWIVLAAGMAMGARQLSGYDQMILAIEGDKRDELGAWLSSGASSEVTDERLAAFSDALQADYGSFQSIPESLWDIMSAYMTLGATVQSAQAAAQQEGYMQPIPIPAEFGGGMTVVIVAGAPAPPSAPNGMPLAENVGFVASDGSVVWLLDPNP